MSTTVDEWVAKAEGDFRTAGRELKATDSPNYDAVCFHSQQAVEKLMKAALISKGQVPNQSHDLVYLADVLAKTHPDAAWPVEDLRFLTRAAVAFRYPGESAEKDEAQEAFDIALRLRELLLALISDGEAIGHR